MNRPLAAGLGAAGLLALAAYYAAGLTSQAGLVHDDVDYLTLAKAIASGAGYRTASLPGSPPHILYPPAYPLLLAPVWLLWPDFPANLMALKAVTIPLLLLGVVLAHQLARRAYGATPAQALLVAAVVGLSRYHTTFADLTMSEPLFTAVVLGALLVLERAPTAWAGRWWLPGAIAAAAVAPTYVRSIGVTLIAASVAWLLLRRQVGLAVRSGLLMGALLLPWAAWVAWARSQPAPALNYVDWVGDRTGGFSLLGILADAPARVATLATTSLPGALAPLLADSRLFASPSLRMALGSLLTGLMAVGLWRLRQPSWPLLPLFLVAYLGLVAVYPWDPSRFAYALAPLLAIALVRGATSGVDALGEAGRWPPRGRRAIAAWLVVALVAAAGLSGGVRVLSLAKNGLRHDDLLPPAARTAQADGRALAAWGRATLPPDAVWLHPRDPLMWLLTDRQATSYYDGPEPSPARRALFRARPTFLVVEPAQTDEFVTTHAKLLAAHPERLTRVWTAPGGTLVVYAVARDWP